MLKNLLLYCIKLAFPSIINASIKKYSISNKLCNYKKQVTHYVHDGFIHL